MKSWICLDTKHNWYFIALFTFRPVAAERDSCLLLCWRCWLHRFCHSSTDVSWSVLPAVGSGLAFASCSWGLHHNCVSFFVFQYWCDLWYDLTEAYSHVLHLFHQSKWSANDWIMKKWTLDRCRKLHHCHYWFCGALSAFCWLYIAALIIPEEDLSTTENFANSKMYFHVKVYTNKL